MNPFHSISTTSPRHTLPLPAVAPTGARPPAAPDAPAPHAADVRNASSTERDVAVDPSVVRDVERVRAATSSFRDLNEAVRAGYPDHVAQCFDNPPEGGMGYHHVHPDLMDARLEVEKPEILVYERGRDGSYALVGVEYAVPIDAWVEEEPPSIMGESLRRSERLGIWYLHVWVWRENPQGLFADWNPAVSCTGR